MAFPFVYHYCANEQLESGFDHCFPGTQRQTFDVLLNTTTSLIWPTQLSDNQAVFQINYVVLELGSLAVYG